MATQALAVVHYRDDVEDQAPLLPASARAASGTPLFRRLLAAFACVAVLIVGVCSFSAHSTQKDAAASTAQATATGIGAGIISFVGSHGKKENSTQKGNTTSAGAVESGKGLEVGGALLDNVTQALVMDDTDSKQDDTMLSVKKGEVVYVHNVSKESGWTFVFTKRNRKSGFVPSMVLNENSTLVRRNYTPAEKNAKFAVEVKAGDRVWLTGIKESGKDWIYVVKPDKDTGLLTGFIPEWAVGNSANSTANNSKSPANSTPTGPEEKAPTKKAASETKKEKHNQK